MANTSIYNAFERMWLHVVAKLGDKANAEHTHDDIYYTETEVDSLLGNKADATHNHDDVYYTETEIDELIAAIPIGEPIVDITDRISNNSFDFSAVESGLYWSSSVAGINIGGSNISGLFVVLKMMDTVANVWAVHTGTSFICNNGTISAVKRSLMTAQDYYDLTTTSKQILGAINELDAQLDSHAHAIADVTDLQLTLDTKAAQTSLDAHTGNADIHFTAAERTKLSGIEEAANHTVVDTALSASSENPVQNKAIYSVVSDLTSTVSANTSSISAHTQSISDIQNEINSWKEITSAEVQALFSA